MAEADPRRAPSAAAPADRAPLKHQFGNFDAIRIVGAVAVLYSHSYMVAEASEESELFQMLFGETFGMFFIYMFFVMSGFLITRSWFGSKGVGDYAFKRLLRLYPAYLASVAFVALVMGPWGYQMWNWRPYWTDPYVITAVVEALFFKLDHELLILPSVVLYEDDQYMGFILNAVIWTIQVEIFMYAAIALLGVLRLLRIEVVGLLALVGFFAHLTDTYLFLDLNRYVSVDRDYADLLVFNWWSASWGAPGFFAGSFLYFLVRTHRLSGRIAAAFAAACVVALLIDWGPLLPEDASPMRFFALLCAYPVVWFGHSGAPSAGNWTRYGDLSYGLYIFGWPIQQIVRAFTGDGLTGLQFFPLCLPPALLVAYLSWHLIEKRALAYKPSGAKGGKPPEAGKRGLLRLARRRG